MKNSSQSESEILRQKAEALLHKKLTKTVNQLSEADAQRLIHELEVHQIELELQNQELILAREQATTAAEKYIDLYDFAPSGYFTLLRKGEILQLNLMGAKMLGKERSQLINSQFQFFISDDSKPIFRLSMEKAFRSNTMQTCEVTLSVNGSSPRYVHLTGVVAENAEHCYVTATDITERKQAEKKVMRSEERYRNLFENATEGLILLTMDGKIAEVNQAFARMHGYTVEEMKNMDIKELDVLREDTFDARAEVMKSILAGEVVRFEVEHYHKAGHSFFMRDSASLINIENQQYFLAFHQDITELKLAEQELIIAKEHAEESDRLKSAFLANMSHEIRTPMNGILGFANLLKEPDLAGEKQQEYIKIIEKSGIRMLNIINDIVDISKIEAGLMEVKLSESNINEQIEYLYTFFKPEVEKKGIKFSYKIALPAKEAIINCDREKLYAILTNLVKNAIKYTKGGAIEFGYEIVETHGNVETRLIASLHNRASIQFYVKDTGMGIPKNRQEAIFERFIQADIDDKHAYQGAGLGLSISKAYAEMLGGKIWVKSDQGIGSTFYFALPYNAGPIEKTAVQNAVASVATGKIARNLKILIAEDDEVSEMLIDIIVKRFGKEILKAGTGAEAVEICRKYPDIDLILMDIQMPKIGGYEATRQIRKFNKEVIIIAQTAFGLSGDRQKAIAAGCNDYISKPISKAELIALIQKYFG